MIDKPLDTIEAADIESLCFRGVSESRNLEFKRDLPGKTDLDVKEFLDDVTAMANAQGGDIIYGVDADGGMAKEVALLELSDRGEAEILRLENSLRDNVEPRLTVYPRWIPYGHDRGVLLLRIPASLAYPHRRIFKGSSRFSIRSSAGKYEMDVHELRQAFTQSEQLPKRFRSLHEEAVADASRGLDMPFALKSVPTAVATIAPLGFFREERDLPITRQNAVLPPPRPGTDTRVDPLMTLEGVLAGRTTLDGELLGYVLTHRTGRVDAAWTIGDVHTWDGGETTPLVWPQRFEQSLADLAGATDARFREFGVVGPWVVFATVLRLHGFELLKDRNFSSRPAWRNEATFRELITDNLKSEALEPIFQSLWLMFGEERPS